MNNDILDKDTYAPIVEAGWNYIADTAIQPDGTLGYVQSIGEKVIPC